MLPCPALQAFLIDAGGNRVDFVGNRTECALIMLAKGWGFDYKKVREENEARVEKVSL